MGMKDFSETLGAIFFQKIMGTEVMEFCFKSFMLNRFLPTKQTLNQKSTMIRPTFICYKTHLVVITSQHNF